MLIKYQFCIIVIYNSVCIQTFSFSDEQNGFDRHVGDVSKWRE